MVTHWLCLQKLDTVTVIISEVKVNEICMQCECAHSLRLPPNSVQKNEFANKIWLQQATL